MLIKAAVTTDADELERIYASAFESNGPFFPDDMVEEEDDGEAELSFASAIALSEKIVLSIWEDGRLIGGAVISSGSHETNLLERLFILPAEHGKGYGYRAWVEIEKTHTRKGGWTLKTPTCLINNVYFYVNKCGFSIIRVEDMGSDGVGMYVFAKPAS